MILQCLEVCLKLSPFSPPFSFFFSFRMIRERLMQVLLPYALEWKSSSVQANGIFKYWNSGCLFNMPVLNLSLFRHFDKLPLCISLLSHFSSSSSFFFFFLALWGVWGECQLSKKFNYAAFFFFFYFKKHVSCLRKQTNLIKAIRKRRLEWKCLCLLAYVTVSDSCLISGLVLMHFWCEQERNKDHTHCFFYFHFKVWDEQWSNAALNIKGKRAREKNFYFKARVYLLQTNCSRGSALEGCALGRGWRTSET